MSGPPPRGSQRDGIAACLGRPPARHPADRGHDAPLPDPDQLRAAPRQRQRRRPRAALVRRIPGRDRPRGDHATAQVTRRHIEDYKPWLACRPGQNKPQGDHRDHRPPAGHPADVLRPPRRMGLGRGPATGADVPRRPAPPRPPAAQGPRRRQPPRNCCAPRRTTSACSSASPWRCCCAPGCGSASTPRCAPTRSCRSAPGPWLHVPVGKLREDRYLPLHPHLVALIDDYRTRTSHPGNPLLLPRENGNAAGPARRHPLHQQGRRRRRAAPHPPPPAPAHSGHPGDQPRA